VAQREKDRIFHRLGRNGLRKGPVKRVRAAPRRDLGDLGLERGDRSDQLAQAAQLVAGDPDARRLLGASQTPPDWRRRRDPWEMTSEQGSRPRADCSATRPNPCGRLGG
jgi:hypothetical protein